MNKNDLKNRIACGALLFGGLSIINLRYIMLVMNTINIADLLLCQLNNINTIAFPFMYVSMLIGDGVEWINEKQVNDTIRSKMLRMWNNSLLSATASIVTFFVVNVVIGLLLYAVKHIPLHITVLQIIEVGCSLIYIIVRMTILFSICYSAKDLFQPVVGEVLILTICFVDFYGYIVRDNVRPLLFVMGEHTIFNYSYGFTDCYRPNRILAPIYWICLGLIITCIYYFCLKRKQNEKNFSL